MYLVNLISIFMFLVTCAYFDLKDRVIPNELLKFYLLITFIMIAFEVFIYLHLILWYIIIKLTVLGLIFIITLALFSLKLIGGGDGKVLLLLFHSLSFIHIFYFLKYYFLIFGSFLITILIFIFISNRKEKKNEKRKALINILSSVLSASSKLNMNLKSKDLRSLR